MSPSRSEIDPGTSFGAAATAVPPGPQFAGRAMFLWKQRRDPLRTFLDARRRYGDIVRFSGGGKSVYLLLHPTHIRRVLQENASNYSKDGIFEDRLRPMAGAGLIARRGKDWLRRRRVLSPLFTLQAAELSLPAMADAVEAHLRRWDLAAAQGDSVDLLTSLEDLNYDVIGRLLLCLPVEPGDFLSHAMRAATRSAVGRIERPFPAPPWLPTPANRRFVRTRGELAAMVSRTIESRRQEGGRSDVASQLLTLRGGDGEPQFSTQELCDEILSLVLAWHAGPPTAMFWALLLLSQHPHALARLQEEVDRELAGRRPSVADLARLPFVDMVVREALRLYPPLWAITRLACAEDVIDGYRIEPGSKIILSPFVTHRHEDYWDAPESFRPERFSAGEPGGEKAWSYIPFGRGVRQCPGEHFANIEVRLALSMIAQRYRLSLPPLRETRLLTLPNLQPAQRAVAFLADRKQPTD